MTTITELLSQLQTDKNNLVANLISKGVEASETETFTSLVPKVLAISTGIDTSDATATEGDILFDKTAYVDGQKLTGTIESLEATEYIPSEIDQTIEAGKYLAGNQIIKGDMNLLPTNIRKGVTIFGVEGQYDSGGGGGIEESTFIDCTSFNSSTEVYNEYSNIIMVSQDGTYQNFSNLEDGSTYNRICAYYGSGLAGINLRAGVSNSGFYGILPMMFSSNYALLKTVYFISSWITPAINIKLIQADSVDEIPTKIQNSDFVYQKTVTLVSTTNSQPTFFELTDLPIGEYYVFVEIPSSISGNDATLATLNFLFM